MGLVPCTVSLCSFTSGKLADYTTPEKSLWVPSNNAGIYNHGIKAILCLPRVVPGMGKKNSEKELYAQNRGSGMCVNFQGSMRPQLLGCSRILDLVMGFSKGGL